MLVSLDAAGSLGVSPGRRDLVGSICRRRGRVSMSVALSSHAAFLGTLEGASTIALSAYVLRPNCDVVSALERAAGRGAAVAVTLDALPYGGATPNALALVNARTAALLRGHGVTVRFADADGPPLHMKAAVVDGIAFLDDRNWPAAGDDTIVRTDDRENVALVAAALRGQPGANAHLATEKGAALRLEAAEISGAPGDRVDIETESFGATAVSAALRARAAAGTKVRLVVAARDIAPGSRERASLVRLSAAGVDVRVSRDAEKLCVAGDRAWIGSANATYSSGPVIDWGLATGDPPLVTKIAADFERNWAAAKPLYAPKRPSAVARVRAATSATLVPSKSATNAAVAAM